MSQTAPRADTTGTSPPQIDRRAQNVVFATVALGMLLAALDQTIVSTALPTIVGDLGEPGHQAWVVTSYLLAETVMTAVAGKLGDLFGRKIVFQVAVLVFVIGSALSGAAQSMEWLIGARAIQGLGGGALTVTATALIGDVIPLRERGRYQGMLGGVFGLTTVLGPLIGGLFTDDLSWRWAFYVNVPVAIVVIVLSARTIPALRTAAQPVIDYAGIVFVGIGVAGLTLAVSWGGTTYPWLSTKELGLIGISIVALIVFVFIESRAREPVLPLRLFRNRVFTTCCALSFIVGFAMLGALTFLPTFEQYVFGVSAIISGVRLLPMVIGLMLTSVTAGTIVGRTGRYKIFPVVGSIVIGIGLFLLSRMTAGTSTVLSSAYLLVLGLGIGLSMQVLTLIVQNTASYADLGVATSGVTFFRTLGSSFGASVFGSLYTNFLKAPLSSSLRTAKLSTSVTDTPEALHRVAAGRIAPVVHAYAQALDKVFMWAIPVSAVGLVVALALREVPLRGSSQASAGDIGDGFGMPTQQSSLQRLERAIAGVIRARGRDALPTVIAQSGTTLGPAGAWGVVEILRYRQAFGHATVAEIARRHHLPSAVLEPTFSALDGEGVIDRSDGELRLTDLGEGEVDRVIGSFRAWLAGELSDWGDGSDGVDSGQIGDALEDISRRLLQDRDERRLPAALAPGPGPGPGGPGGSGGRETGPGDGPGGPGGRETGPGDGGDS